MTTQMQPSLSAFTDWIRATDAHADHRLRLVAEVEPILEGHPSATEARRSSLAERLERWRYQRLNERCGSFESQDRGLADALDLAANELTGRTARPPRWPREAVEEDRSDSVVVAQAKPCLDPRCDLTELSRRAAEVTLAHFGVTREPIENADRKRRVLLYAPIYLSSHCVNDCSYCGFNYALGIERKRLTLDEALREAELLGGRGLRHLLLVAGEYPSLTKPEYFSEILGALAARGFRVGVEIAPQSTGAYAELAAAGACGVTLYQETYNEELYALYHRRGPKRFFDWRLEGLERAADAGIQRLGLGVLLGLADPREDVLAMIRHADYLKTCYPDRTLAFSLPRIYRAPASFQTPYPADDDTFVRLYCTLRLAFPEAELVLSTREPADLRHRLAAICITQMSAGSSTAPGGYALGKGDRRILPEGPEGCLAQNAPVPFSQHADEQFPVADHRPPSEVACCLREAGLEPIWDL